MQPTRWRGAQPSPPEDKKMPRVAHKHTHTHTRRTSGSSNETTCLRIFLVFCFLKTYLGMTHEKSFESWLNTKRLMLCAWPLLGKPWDIPLNPLEQFVTNLQDFTPTVAAFWGWTEFDEKTREARSLERGMNIPEKRDYTKILVGRDWKREWKESRMIEKRNDVKKSFLENFFKLKTRIQTSGCKHKHLLSPTIILAPTRLSTRMQKSMLVSLVQTATRISSLKAPRITNFQIALRVHCERHNVRYSFGGWTTIHLSNPGTWRNPTKPILWTSTNGL